MARRKTYLVTRLFFVGMLFFFDSLGLFILAFGYRSGRFSSLSWLGIPVILFFLSLLTLYYWVYLPYKTTKHILLLFSTGYTFESIIDKRCPINKEMEEVDAKLHSLLNTDQLMNASKRQAQFLALQNQINPHFLYNTLEGIRSEALFAGLTSVASMTEALSTFFRYTISNVENLVTLEQELENTENYFFIQQFRFGNRLKLSVTMAEEDKKEVMQYRIPKLTLQPIVENCIIHGLECKVGEGVLRIHIETTQSRLLVTVSDDGVGMGQQVLQAMNHNLSVRSLDYVKHDELHGGIALVNVNNRIKLLFGEQYGLTVTSQVGVGTDVLIVLPRSIQEGETT
ncbi:histidine kinase [Sphaerochaeta pleomorpha str. Grapes]|uniref:Histidine kinase n=1 Tax=Sphaerochaeta pleomorpha (strain ATCC BAA-1885 / DSM 22778 / Grapes) TaxID=158190 RepID=G8QVK5_SPHPG|nr:sensor histidine kinase [Sphaerochaeta pleomorpha]AEV28238.1 histidine kinase [Sphaerochaeta pleomorpha str. Grapes]